MENEQKAVEETKEVTVNQGSVKKSFLKNAISDFILGILGGLCISLGGIAFLASGGGIIGALFFVVGLFTICTFNFNLYTGKVCYVLDNKPTFWWTVIFTYLGNVAGTLLAGYGIQLTRFVDNPNTSALIESVANTKINDEWYSIFILAILCNIMIFIAVDGFKNNKHDIGKYLSLFFGVSVFVLCGFEHSIADMFYFTIANVWSVKSVLFILLITLGNAIGGLIIPVIRKFIKN